MLTASLSTLATDAGDSAALLPVALVSSALLWRLHSRRLAWLLLRSVVAAGAAIVLLKLLFLSCGLHWFAGFTSPSGHACMSAAVYGSLGMLLATGRPPWVRALLFAIVALVVATIAITRVRLGVHSWSEVLVGLAVGTAACAWFARSYARVEPVRVDGRVFGAAVLATVLLAFGARMPAESFLRHLAKRMGDACTFAAGHGPRSAAGAPAAGSTD